MAAYTRYLTATVCAPLEFEVWLTARSPVEILQAAATNFAELRYSPVLPAFLTPGEIPLDCPEALESLGFLFSSYPYSALGALRGQLNADERPNVYFSEGLASIVTVNFDREKVSELRTAIGGCPLEYWPLRNNRVLLPDISFEILDSQTASEALELPTTAHHFRTIHFSASAAQ